MMPRIWMRSVAALALLCAGCGQPAHDGPPEVVVSIPPVAMIVGPLVNGPIHVLAPGGASPHTYEPRPSDATAATGAKLLIHVADDLDGWATELGAQNLLSLLSLVPERDRLHYEETHDHDGHTHEHHAVDPHFWMDPVLVEAIVPEVVTKLKEAGVRVNSEKRIRASLSKYVPIDAMLKDELASLKGKAVAQFHPSMNYLFRRYGIGIGGFVEASPGKQASPKYLHEMAERLKADGVIAVATEPQLPEGPARAVAEAAEIPLLTLDPIGGVENSYFELMQFNAESLASVAP